MSKSVALAREEITRILLILENIESMRVEPFSVNISNVLDKLRSVIEENRDSEMVVLDAETLYKVAVVLGLQQRWIRERAASLFIDSQLITNKIMYCSKDSLVRSFLAAWHPLVRIDQITFHYLLKGYDYFLSLPSRIKRSSESRMSDRDVKVPEWKFYDEAEARRRVEELRAELMMEGRWVDYWEFVRRGELGTVYERAYFLSHLISRGLVEIAIDMLNDKVMIRYSEGARELTNPTSFVTSLSGG
ncbi:MAG: hypothetical protein NZ920_01905 [Aigarchaeota archaeon]|nr:hypothetical protein [Aigarchaeota archaeon]MDW8093198.1 hypothetical protein [Nitrososphaerota archaeon]